MDVLKETLKKIDLSHLSMRERVIAGVAAAAVLFFFVFFILVPKSREIEGLKKQKNALAGEVELGLARIPVLQKRYEDLKKTAEAMGEVPEDLGDPEAFILLDTNRLSVLLEEITQLARMQGIEFVAVRPSVMADQGAYYQLPIQIEIRSPYRALGEYLRSLEDLSRGFLIENLQIKDLADDPPMVLAHLSGRTFLGKE